MTVYIGSAAFVAQLQRERNEALAENRRLLKELAAAQAPQSEPDRDKCMFCGQYPEGGSYKERSYSKQVTICFKCFDSVTGSWKYGN